MFRAVIFSLLVMNKIYVPSHFENLSNSVFTLHLYLFMNKYSIIHFVLIFLLFINTYKKITKFIKNKIKNNIYISTLCIYIYLF